MAATKRKEGDVQKTMMSVEEVAERWGVHPRTIYTAVREKQIIALRVGRLIKIARSHVEYLEQNGNSLGA